MSSASGVGDYFLNFRLESRGNVRVRCEESDTVQIIKAKIRDKLCEMVHAGPEAPENPMKLYLFQKGEMTIFCEEGYLKDDDKQPVNRLRKMEPSRLEIRLPAPSSSSAAEGPAP